MRQEMARAPFTSCEAFFFEDHTVDEIVGSLLRGQRGIQVDRLIRALAPDPAMRALLQSPKYSVSVYFML
jgi:hypothetical protein